MAHGKSQPSNWLARFRAVTDMEGAIMKSKDEKHQVFTQAGVLFANFSLSPRAGRQSLDLPAAYFSSTSSPFRDVSEL